ncbi:MAG: asparagine synthase-related protein [Actinomycetota bacterium]
MSHAEPGGSAELLRTMLPHLPSGHQTLTTPGPANVSLAVWGQLVDLIGHRHALAVAHTFEGGRSVPSKRAAELALSADLGAFSRLLPPAAAVALDDDGSLVVATDHLGLRQLFVASRGNTAAVSTCSSAVAQWLGAGLDEEALAVQSLLGWQLGERTLFRGVTRLGAGVRGHLGRGRMTVRQAERATPGQQSMDVAVGEAAALLSSLITTTVETNSEVLLQLSGGLDTRIVLAAVPRDLRRGLAAMTLGDESSPDVAVARDLAGRFEMEHTVLPLDGLEIDSPDVAADLCHAASRRLDYVADPLSTAAIRRAERGHVQTMRIGGIGGEAARGFYHTGPVLPIGTSRLASRLVARYRMFVNERVSEPALRRDFADWAQRFTETQIDTSLRSMDDRFYRALDEFYLRERLQRWAGATSTAVVFDRGAVHPMLDHRFIDIVRSVSPVHTARNRFAAELVVRLDSELAEIELDGRPSPSAYAGRSVGDKYKVYTSVGTKFTRKVYQRLERTRRPPIGASVLAESMRQYWQAHPEDLAPLTTLGLFRDEWLDGVAAGTVRPNAVDVAFLTNVIAARSDAESQRSDVA